MCSSDLRAADCERRSTVREVRRLEVRRAGSLVEIEIEATAFLKHMVRIVAGTLVEVGRGQRRVGERHCRPPYRTGVRGAGRVSGGASEGRESTGSRGSGP